MLPKPHINWPYYALQERNAPLLKLIHGIDQDVANLAEEHPRVGGIILGGPELSDTSTVHLCRLKYLKSLSVFSTKITTDGMTNVSRLHHLTTLELSGNQHFSSVPFENFKNLSSLTISNCKCLCDSVVLGSIAKLPHLTSLALCEFPISFYGATFLSNLKSIKSLMLEFCDISDAVFCHVGKMESLTALHIKREPCFSSGSFANLATLSTLTSLQVTCCGLTDTGMIEICTTIPTLRKLHLTICKQITKDGFAPLTHLAPTLTSIDVSHSLITDHVLAQTLSTLNNLTKLDMAHCQGISDYGCMHLASLNLTSLNVSHTSVKRTTVDRLLGGRSSTSSTQPIGDNQFTFAGHLRAQLTKFHQIVMSLDNSNFSDEDLKSMGLRFSIPRLFDRECPGVQAYNNDCWPFNDVELIPNGMTVAVDGGNLHEFQRLVSEKVAMELEKEIPFQRRFLVVPG